MTDANIAEQRPKSGGFIPPVIKFNVMDGKAGVGKAEAWTRGLYCGEPYVSGEQPVGAVVKLNTNENPYPPAPGVLRALSEFDGTKLRLYPKQDGGKLKEAIASRHGLAAENVFVGNGSDEVLALAFRACFGKGAGHPVLFSDVTYSFYPVWCEFFGIPFTPVASGPDFRVRAEDYGRPNGGIVLCDPNAPTGIGEGEAFLDRVIQIDNGRSVLIVDEAYADFAEFSAVQKTKNVLNLLVVRSFSKGYSLAGQRIGYAVGSERLIRALTTAKDSFNSYPIDAVTEAIGVAALDDEAYYLEKIGEIKKTRRETVNKLRALGFDVPESSANFVFAGCGSPARAKEIFEYLRKNGVYIRYFNRQKLSDRLRISIGTPEDMETFFKRLEDYLAL